MSDPSSDQPRDPISRFARDTAVEAVGPGRYRGSIDRGWWIERGPNGGYVAALVLRAITAEVADPERHPRSLTLHYLRPPAEGAVDVDVVVEREGRSLSSVTARLSQDGLLCAVAVAALSVDRQGVVLRDESMPVVPPPEDIAPPPADRPTIPLTARYDMRWAIGDPPFTGGTEARAGGWIRLAEPDVVDAHLLVALADAWVPPIFSKVAEPLAVPTVDLTVHLLDEPHPAEEWVLVEFATRWAGAGFLEEDGRLWSRDGRLLAQARQLAAVLTFG
ncbi:MAG: thioesterase family protein [Acidimicrobiales bacterium]